MISKLKTEIESLRSQHQKDLFKLLNSHSLEIKTLHALCTHLYDNGESSMVWVNDTFEGFLMGEKHMCSICGFSDEYKKR